MEPLDYVDRHACPRAGVISQHRGVDPSRAPPGRGKSKAGAGTPVDTHLGGWPLTPAPPPPPPPPARHLHRPALRPKQEGRPQRKGRAAFAHQALVPALHLHLAALRLSKVVEPLVRQLGHPQAVLKAVVAGLQGRADQGIGEGSAQRRVRVVGWDSSQSRGDHTLGMCPSTPTVPHPTPHDRPMRSPQGTHSRSAPAA